LADVKADVVPLELWSDADTDEPVGVVLVRRRALAERAAAPAQLWTSQVLVDVGHGLPLPQVRADLQSTAVGASADTPSV